MELAHQIGLTTLSREALIVDQRVGGDFEIAKLQKPEIF